LSSASGLSISAKRPLSSTMILEAAEEAEEEGDEGGDDMMMMI
jgi:hypothetical protein